MRIIHFFSPFSQRGLRDLWHPGGRGGKGASPSLWIPSPAAFSKLKFPIIPKIPQISFPGAPGPEILFQLAHVPPALRQGRAGGGAGHCQGRNWDLFLIKSPFTAIFLPVSHRIPAATPGCFSRERSFKSPLSDWKKNRFNPLFWHFSLIFLLMLFFSQPGGWAFSQKTFLGKRKFYWSCLSSQILLSPFLPGWFRANSSDSGTPGKAQSINPI